jgi:hypothetical protein
VLKINKRAEGKIYTKYPHQQFKGVKIRFKMFKNESSFGHEIHVTDRKKR